MKRIQENHGPLNLLPGSKTAMSSFHQVRVQDHHWVLYMLHQSTKEHPIKQTIFTLKSRSVTDRLNKISSGNPVNKQINKAFRTENLANGLYYTISSHEKQYPAHWRDYCNPS